LPNRQQEFLRLEPATGVDHHVVGSGVGRIDDESVDVAQVLASRAFDVQAIEVNLFVFHVAGIDVLEPRLGMIHRRLQFAHCAQLRRLEQESSP
jgi:hypothetical protein